MNYVINIRTRDNHKIVAPLALLLCPLYSNDDNFLPHFCYVRARTMHLIVYNDDKFTTEIMVGVFIKAISTYIRNIINEI